MITKRTETISGKQFHVTASDTYQIRKVGTDEIYSEAWDVTEHEYEETDLLLETEEDSEEESL